MVEVNKKLDFSKRIKITNEDLYKLLPNDTHWILPISIGESFVGIPLKNFQKIGISLNDIVCEIYKEENGDIFLELSSLYYRSSL